MEEHSRPTITVILGAGASRDVSYDTGVIRSGRDHRSWIPSPLDFDFFDLLQRLEARTEPGTARESIRGIIKKIVNFEGEQPLWQSMERAFYNLHERAVLDYQLFRAAKGPDLGHELIEDFLASIRALLDEAHGEQISDNHRYLFQRLYHPDAVLTFNYDFVAERAVASRFYARHSPDTSTRFGEWFYALAEREQSAPIDVPTLYKLHGSLNWKLEDEHGETRNARRDWPGNWPEFAKELVYTPTVREGYGQDKRWRPPILLPYWEKRVESGVWLELWRAAAEQLRKTDILIIWGYSLPATDLKARELLSLAFGREGANLRRVVVIDPSKETQERWRRMFLRQAFFRYQSFKEFKPDWLETGWPDYA